MKKTILLVPILLGGLLAGCGEEPKAVEEKSSEVRVNSYVKAEEEVVEEEVFEIDINLEQHKHGSRIIQTETEYFYSSEKDNNRIYRSPIKEETNNTNTPTKLKSEVSMLAGVDLIHHEDRIYYSNTLDEGKIYSFKIPDFNEDIVAEPLNISKSRDLVVNEDGISYINEDDGDKVYFTSYDGAINKAITQDRAGEFIHAEYVTYYQNADDGYNLYAMDVKENKRYKLTDFSVESFIVLKDFILATNSDDDNSLYIIKSNKSIEKLSNRKAFELRRDLNQEKADLNEFYYLNENKQLMRCNLEEEMKIQSEEKISNDLVEDYYFTDDKIMIKDEEEVLKSYNK
ncbi:MAG: DUF5050 domain-containing protein [Sarcina sp.]